MSKNHFRPFLTGLLLAVASAACTSSVEEGESLDDESAEGEDAGSNEPQVVDLFACNLPLDCPAVCTHLGTGDCSEPAAVDCAYDLKSSGSTGVLLHENRPGPSGSLELDDLIILLGDDSFIMQRRTRSCSSCDLSTVPWVVERQGICDGAMFTYEPTCVPIETERSCSDVQAILGG
jgi:hypothetical protein